MKKILIGLLALGSLSTLAGEIHCNPTRVIVPMSGYKTISFNVLDKDENIAVGDVVTTTDSKSYRIQKLAKIEKSYLLKSENDEDSLYKVMYGVKLVSGNEFIYTVCGDANFSISSF